MNYEVLEQRYYQNPLITGNDLPCDVLELNTRLRQEQAGLDVVPFKEWIKDFGHQYPNGF